MPVDGCLREMKSGYRADVEAAKLRSLLARRHVHACHFGQVLVPGGGGRLSPEVADWHDVKRDSNRKSAPMNGVLAISDPPRMMLIRSIPRHWTSSAFC